ncbi:unnamed protein product [Paramecium sonneborni]|uniref:Insulin-like growth factor binding protein, N-terminal n=1 Tax=Paramecium sonneborni TaxID=65129 RepID=A0A8S1QTQ4_9CILI|nr:unnamed protein product [Paramecium sonneborni]
MLYKYLLLFFFVKDSQSAYQQELNSAFQFESFTFYSDKSTLEEENHHCFGYGIWSRYVPLSNTAQIGVIGMLDSNCYHLHQAMEQTTQQINFVYYECVNFDSQTVTKYIEFKGSDGVNQNTQFDINPFEYEYVWYFLGFEMVPSENRFSIYFYQENIFIDSKDFQVEFPFYDKDLNLIFGGDLDLNNDQQQYVNLQNNKLSYFPGSMMLLLNYVQTNPQFCRGSSFKSFSNNFDESCECYQRINSIVDADLKYLEIKNYVPNEINCNTFALSTWIRINEIDSFLDEFKYQLIKLSGNFQNQKLIQDNLSAFQLFYKMTKSENQIVVTTYSYTFPAINIDFSDDPFLITKIFNVECDIKLWHQLLVIKGETSIKIQITFYDGYEQYKFQTEIAVIQFHMVQFQFRYGNILQQSSSSFQVQLYMMKFLSCVNSYTFQFICHYTCQECDGPTSSDCLSCFQSSKRKYLAAYKTCVCPYGTIDDGKICQDYLTQKLVLVENEIQKEQCQYGYFEYLDDCWKCPSIISNKFTTCLECLLNPKTWSNIFYCQTLLYTDEYGNTTQFITDLKFQYIFDGNDTI